MLNCLLEYHDWFMLCNPPTPAFPPTPSRSLTPSITATANVSVSDDEGPDDRRLVDRHGPLPQRNVRGTVQARARRFRTEVREIWIGCGCPCRLPRARRWARQCIRRGRTVSPSRKGRASTVDPGAMQRGTVTGVSGSAPNPGFKARRASARIV